ncbi:SOS response-associated peptidase [Bordetella hinzii]|uniref:SOS response-associated peptidase n=1 Tax=Bordetella hinzii TaxID=103855 RepID=UPI001C029F97|nr:SOS response-associated peptidase family protein [Bordetella hinzii]QWF39245.1 SOS response-associated peptidase [Bordetella hinzii]QWF43792.1 SOS response-associated peptidase [Bordetella hinzii]QWF48328.1 SOS response-associated peptidase [Bordetella hinzii]QWF52865.1 SOS response-associated peptidase [Bordetella hinzii]QWF57354.1 SOS response-associated peptidase [Bordetella hinzii]
MCSHYTALKKREQMEKYFRARGIPLPAEWDMWPKRIGEFIRRPPEHDSGDEAVPQREVVAGRWGLISAMTKADGLDKAGKLSTFNARSETAAKSFTFGNAWRRAQHCIVPADAIYEPDWRSGKAVPTRFTRADGAPLGIAGLWDRWRDAAGQLQESYTMLTINADDDPLFKHYHQAGKEKRMVVILPEGAYEDWLTAPAEATRDFLVPYPSDRLVATPMEK